MQTVDYTERCKSSGYTFSATEMAKMSSGQKRWLSCMNYLCGIIDLVSNRWKFKELGAVLRWRFARHRKLWLPLLLWCLSTICSSIGSSFNSADLGVSNCKWSRSANIYVCFRSAILDLNGPVKCASLQAALNVSCVCTFSLCRHLDGVCFPYRASWEITKGSTITAAVT